MLHDLQNLNPIPRQILYKNFPTYSQVSEYDHMRILQKHILIKHLHKIAKSRRKQKKSNNKNEIKSETWCVTTKQCIKCWLLSSMQCTVYDHCIWMTMTNSYKMFHVLTQSRPKLCRLILCVNCCSHSGTYVSHLSHAIYQTSTFTKIRMSTIYT